LSIPQAAAARHLRCHNTISVQDAVETLTEECRDKPEEISDTMQHDRQDITANDAYYIR
jgi:hypothetical protein